MLAGCVVFAPPSSLEEDTLPLILLCTGLSFATLGAVALALRYRMQVTDPNSPKQRLRRMARLLELPSFRDDGDEQSISLPLPPDRVPAQPPSPSPAQGVSRSVADAWGMAASGSETELSIIVPDRSLPADSPAWASEIENGTMSAKSTSERPRGWSEVVEAKLNPTASAGEVGPARNLMTWVRYNARRVWADHAVWREHSASHVSRGKKGIPLYLRFDYVELLGTGAYGAAHLLRDPSTTETVVCKVVKLPNSRGRDNIRLNRRGSRREDSEAAEAAVSPAM